MEQAKEEMQIILDMLGECRNKYGLGYVYVSICRNGGAWITCEENGDYIELAFGNYGLAKE